MITLTKSERQLLLVRENLTLRPSDYCVVCIDKSSGSVVFAQSFISFRRSFKSFPEHYAYTSTYCYVLTRLF